MRRTVKIISIILIGSLHPIMSLSQSSSSEAIKKNTRGLPKGDLTAYSLNGSINKSNVWTVDLFKPVFAVTKLKGEIDQIKLYCSKKYVLFKFEKDKQFEVPESNGDCKLSLIGTPD